MCATSPNLVKNNFIGKELKNGTAILFNFPFGFPQWNPAQYQNIRTRQIITKIGMLKASLNIGKGHCT